MAKRTCQVDGCDHPHLAKGFCSAHWQRWHKTGDPGLAETRQHHTRCSVEGCERPHYGRGYCSPHLRRFDHSGDPGPAAIAGRPETCSVEGCSDPHSARSYCASHYARWRRTGDAGAAFSVRRRDPSARDEQGRKQCRDCDQWFPESSFYQVKSQTDALSPRCAECHYARAICRRYGVEPNWYVETLAHQGGGCAICGAPPNGKRLHIDHDHAHCAANYGCPRCVRGLLCSPCNTGLGMFGEDPQRLWAAMAYVGMATK